MPPPMLAAAMEVLLLALEVAKVLQHHDKLAHPRVRIERKDLIHRLHKPQL